MTIKGQYWAFSADELDAIRRDLKTVGFTEAETMSDVWVIQTLIEIGKASLMERARRGPIGTVQAVRSHMA